MGGITDPNELTKRIASEYQEDQKQKNLDKEKKENLAKKYVAYENASEERKKRIEARDKNRQERYAAHKQRVDARRERYADKMFAKGIVENKNEARDRFDNLRNITVRSRKEADELTYPFKTSDEYKEPEVVDPAANSPSARFNDTEGFGSFTA